MRTAALALLAIAIAAIAIGEFLLLYATLFQKLPWGIDPAEFCFRYLGVRSVGVGVLIVSGIIFHARLVMHFRAFIMASVHILLLLLAILPWCLIAIYQGNSILRDDFQITSGWLEGLDNKLMSFDNAMHISEYMDFYATFPMLIVWGSLAGWALRLKRKIMPSSSLASLASQVAYGGAGTGPYRATS